MKTKMRDLILLIVFTGFISCTSENVEPVQEQNQEIVQYRFQTFLIEVDYSQDLQGPGSPAFTLLEKPNGGMFTTKHASYKPDLYFKAPSIPESTIFTIRGIYSKYDTIKFESFGYGTRYLIRVDK